MDLFMSLNTCATGGTGHPVAACVRNAGGEDVLKKWFAMDMIVIYNFYNWFIPVNMLSKDDIG